MPPASQPAAYISCMRHAPISMKRPLSDRRKYVPISIKRPLLDRRKYAPTSIKILDRRKYVKPDVARAAPIAFERGGSAGLRMPSCYPITSISYGSGCLCPCCLFWQCCRPFASLPQARGLICPVIPMLLWLAGLPFGHMAFPLAS